jgi:hypothetical protein
VAFRYLDVVLVLMAAPLALLMGAPAVGYLAGAGAWLALRAAGVAADRRASAIGDVAKELTTKLFFSLGRVFLLATVVVVVRKSQGRDDGLTALLVIVVAFTIQLMVSITTRPRSPRGRRST